MTFLLDVNVLIALVDPSHIFHERVQHWFAEQGRASWATCPITENGALRIMANPKYQNSPGSPAVIVRVLRRLRGAAGRAFWPDGLSLLDEAHCDMDRMLSHRHVTDSYLLALAVSRGGKLATMDRRISLSCVRGGDDGVLMIPAA